MDLQRGDVSSKSRFWHLVYEKLHDLFALFPIKPLWKLKFSLSNLLIDLEHI